MKNLWQRLLELVFPAFCLGCKAEDTFLCEDCLKKMPRQQTQGCPVCYRGDSGGRVCELCKGSTIFLDGLIAASPFDKSTLLQQAIHVLKYDFVEDLAKPLGRVLAETLKSSAWLSESLLICPVPLHPKRYRWRGFNQAELLTKQMLQFLSNDEQKLIQLLERQQYHKPQMELKREERLQNVENVFALKEGIKIDGAKILLIDDVATTLATLNNCAKVLKKAGAREVFGLVLARVY